MKYFTLLVLGLLLLAPSVSALTFTSVGNSYASPDFVRQGLDINPSSSMPLIISVGPESGNPAITANVYRIHANNTYIEEVADSLDFSPVPPERAQRSAWNTDGTKLALSGTNGSGASRSGWLRVYNLSGTPESPTFSWTGANITTISTPNCIAELDIRWVNTTTLGMSTGGCTTITTRVYYYNGSAWSLQANVAKARFGVSSSIDGFVTHDSYGGGACSSPFLTHVAFNTSSQGWQAWAGTTTPAFPSSSSNCIRAWGWSPNGDYLFTCGSQGSRIYTYSGSNPATANFVARSEISSDCAATADVIWSPDSTHVFSRRSSPTTATVAFSLASNGTWFNSDTDTFDVTLNGDYAAGLTSWFNDGEHLLYESSSSAPVVRLYTSNASLGLPLPSQPLYLTARGNLSAGIRLSWSTPLTPTDTFSGYKIFRGTDDITLTLLATIATNLTYVDQTATVGTRYYYCIKATNFVGDSSCSNIASAIVNTGMFGPDGNLFGEGGIEQMAANLGTTQGGLKSFLAIPFLVAFLVIAWGLAILIPRGIALAISLSVGTLFVAAIGLYPWWGVPYGGMVIAAVLLLRRSRPMATSGE